VKKEWKVILTGKEVLYITNEEKITLEKGMSDVDGEMVSIGGQWINVKTIKGIFRNEEVKHDVEMNANDLHIEQINREFNNDCFLWSTKTPEEKAKREMRIRVLGFWKLEGGRREDKIMRTVYEWIKVWFRFNTKYPRCPAGLWMSFIRMVKPKKKYNLFLTYVIRNDYAIEDWVKYYSQT